jgi:hypothetical protein
VIRTLWHAPDSGIQRARCGNMQALVVTDDPALVTCPQCLEALREEEEQRPRQGNQDELGE